MDSALDTRDPLLSSRFIWVKLFAAIYVVAIPLSHGALPQTWVWELALVFLLLMLPPYVIAAAQQRQAVLLERVVALCLAALAGTGYVLGAPILIIAAIFAHGAWDLAKLAGMGTPFFGWYVTGCMAVDWTYAAALTFYMITGHL